MTACFCTSRRDSLGPTHAPTAPPPPRLSSPPAAAPLADCFEIAYYCVRNSQVHPRFKSLPPLHTLMNMGRDNNGNWHRDPIAIGFDEELG